MILLASALLLVSLLLTLRACWRRLRPGNPSRAMMVAFVNLIAFTTVLALLIEPQGLHRVKQNVLLMTEGADMDAASLLDGTRVYVSPGMIATPEALQNLKNAHWLLDAAQLELREPALANIEVRGFGLKRSQWQSFPADIRVNFQAPAVSGFSGMYWPRTRVAGETLRIGGHYSNLADDTVLTLRLLDPAGSIASEVRARNKDYFSLSARPRGRGNLQYTLQAWSGETLLSEQPVTTSVGTAAPIKIMVQQSAPSFETSQLKNYAAGNGAQVLINTQISRGKSITQSANLSDGAEITFSPQTLAVQDVLIMDGRALVQLVDQPRQWLTDAVLAGLGLLILADTSLLEEFEKMDNGLLAGFELASYPDAQAEVVPRLLGNPASDWQQPLPVAAMLLEASDADVLIDDGHGRGLVTSQSRGLGHIAISLINQSHRWLTSGSRDHWSDYWTALIAPLARPRSDAFLLPQADNAFFKVGERTPVCALSANAGLIATLTPAGTDQAQPAFDIALTAGTQGSPRQCGWFWPQHTGWHQIQLHAQAGGPMLDQQGFFVFDSHQWLAQSQHERALATRERSSNDAGQQDANVAQIWVSEPLDVFWLYVLLVISASLLWLERKLDFSG